MPAPGVGPHTPRQRLASAGCRRQAAGSHRSARTGRVAGDGQPARLELLGGRLLGGAHAAFALVLHDVGLAIGALSRPDDHGEHEAYHMKGDTMDYRKQFVVEPEAKVRLEKIDPAYTGKHESHAKAIPEIQAHVARMDTLQNLLYADGNQSLLVVLQA